jgi:hypothetical protein
VEGTEIGGPGARLGLLVGHTATFRFFSSSTRADDVAGLVLDEWETEDLEELPPLRVRLDGGREGRVPVKLAAHLTELGALELWCTTGEAGERWKLELDLRGPERRAP